ncbi:hypothetical protein AB0C57_29610 [Streptomyces abikoensis]
MDEPFSALDVLTAENLRGELMELWTSGQFPTRAFLLVTHDIEEAVLRNSVDGSAGSPYVAPALVVAERSRTLLV